MDRVLNPKLEEHSIYEIYRACRLCGAGAGYKMPIVQNVVGLDDLELKLSQKIRECVQIEVHPDDKMPPLICELCVDKVNDFYEFLEMCRQTNKRTRLKLGLPLVNAPKGVQEPTDCILGDTEPVFINSDSDGEPLAKQKRKTIEKSKDKSKEKYSRLRKELEEGIKVENITSAEFRSSRSMRARRVPTPPPGSPPPPPRVTRTSAAALELLSTQHQDLPKKSKPKPHAPIKSIKKEKEDIKSEDETPSRSKRSREKEVKTDVPMKKVKLVLEPCPTSMKTVKEPCPTSTKTVKEPCPTSMKTVKEPCPTSMKTLKPSRSRVAHSPPQQLRCIVCGHRTGNKVGHSNHMRSHHANFTNPKLACNPCGEWFPSLQETQSHHNDHKHQPYKCRRCTAQFQHLEQYDDHFSQQCIPYDEVPDVRCADCWRHFATDKLLIDHKCAGEEGRPGGKCPKCNRTYVLLKNLIRHESTCLHRKRDKWNINPKLLAKLKPLTIRVARCDPLLKKNRWGRYDVSDISNYGFDENSYYPYSPGQIKIKSEPFDGMVKINEEIEKEFLSDDSYIHWDSDSDTDGPDKIPKLATLAMKTIFSPKCLGKIPKKKRNIMFEPTGSPIVNEDLTNSVSAIDEIIDVNKIGDKLVSTEDSSNKDEQNVEISSRIDSLGLHNTSLNESAKSQERWKYDIGESEMENIKISKVETLREVVNNNGKIDTENAKVNDEINPKNGYQDRTSETVDFKNGVTEIDETSKENGVNNYMEKFNGNDDFDSEIDGDKLLAALNAQIGEDDEDDKVIDEKQSDKNNEQKGSEESIDGKKCDSLIGNGKDDKNHKLSLDELLAKDSKQDLNSISDEDFNFDV